MSEVEEVLDAQVKRLQDHNRHLQERLANAQRERDEALDALRPFADEHRWARIAPRSAFARAADLVPEEK